jgi:sugar phosphate isomerase/epimerase
MEIGFLTNSLAHYLKTYGELAEWAVAHGFRSLEVGPTVKLDEKEYEKAAAKHGVKIEAFIYCRNILAQDAAEADGYKAFLMERIKLAGKIGVPKVICTTGITPQSSDVKCASNFAPEASIPAVKEALSPFMEEAVKQGVKLCFENCPMMGGIVHSPYMWDLVFDALDCDQAGLAYDPSHLYWQMMDPYEAIKAAGKRIFHVHAKDASIDRAALGRVGILHSFSYTAQIDESGLALPHGNRKPLWWHYRLPGLGELNWPRIFMHLHDVGYTGFVSIEHEDPVWSGSEDNVKTGILNARDFLQKVYAP